jgi:hypothetical protein
MLFTFVTFAPLDISGHDFWKHSPGLLRVFEPLQYRSRVAISQIFAPSNTELLPNQFCFAYDRLTRLYVHLLFRIN